MKCVFAITDYKSVDKLEQLFSKLENKFSFSLSAYGTAQSITLNYLGIENKKILKCAICHDSISKELLTSLKEDMHFTQKNAGVAFAVPVTRVTKSITKIIGDSNGEERHMQEITHELIITIVDKGCAEEVRNTARAAGSRGGTLLHGLGLGGAEAEKILGISIKPEKDIILIVVEKEQSQNVMSKITKAVGLNTENHGICFALPVDNAVGLLPTNEIL